MVETNRHGLAHFLRIFEVLGTGESGAAQFEIVVEPADAIRRLFEFLRSVLDLGFRHDADVPLAELGGEAHVLSAPSDGKRELIVVHRDLGPHILRIEDDAVRLRRFEGVGNEFLGVVAPANDVDLLAFEFVEHVANARPAHADTRHGFCVQGPGQETASPGGH